MKIRGAKALAPLALLGAAALVISGCSAGNTGAPTETESAEAAPALPATDWVRADAADVQDGGTLTLAVGSLPVQFNTNQVDGNEADTVDINELTFGGPFKISEDGTPVIDENYAVSAEITSEDPQVVEIKLNPDAVWEDGTPITAEDYIAFWEAQNGTNEAYTPASTAGYEDISSVEQGDDEFHVVITFSQVYADWQGLFGTVLPAAISSDPAAYNDGYRTKAVPSSGPFRISSIDTTGQVVTLERNPEWWGETPKLETVLFRAVSQDQQGSSFANSEIDALYISANADLYQTAQTRADAEIQTSGGVTWTHVTMNAKEGPLSDVNVRKAVASIVNREQIAAAANTPVDAPAITQGDYIFMPGQNGYEDKALPLDADAATAFLEEAGYEGSAADGWTKDGEALELSVTVPADTATNIQRSEQVQADLGEFGIPVELITVPAAQYFSDYVIPGDFEMVSFSWVGTAFPISSSEALYYPLDSESNFTGTTDDRLGDLYDQSNSELDPDARIEIAKQINDVIWDYVPMFGIAPLPNVYAVKEGLVNWGATQFETIDWTTVGWAAE